MSQEAWPPCGSESCPVPEPSSRRLRLLRTTVVEEGAVWWRGHNQRYSPEKLVPEGRGNTRFAPLAGASHIYIGATRTVALLESALHEATGPEPTIYLSRLVHWVVSAVELSVPVRLADLRSSQLERIGIERAQLVDTTPRHFECTRRWGEAIRRCRPGGYALDGMVWHSRQADLHAIANIGGVFSDVVIHAPAEVAVLWHPPCPEAPVVDLNKSVALVTDGELARLLVELSALIRVPLIS